MKVYLHGTILKQTLEFHFSLSQPVFNPDHTHKHDSIVCRWLSQSFCQTVLGYHQVKRHNALPSLCGIMTVIVRGTQKEVNKTTFPNRYQDKQQKRKQT